MFNERSLRFHMKNFATTFIGGARFWACRRTRQRRALSSHRKLARSYPFQKLVVCIIATNVAPLDG